MENNREKTANIDSQVASKKATDDTIGTAQLYAHGLEYAQNVKQREEATPRPKKKKYIGPHSPTIID